MCALALVFTNFLTKHYFLRAIHRWREDFEKKKNKMRVRNIKTGNVHYFTLLIGVLIVKWLLNMKCYQLSRNWLDSWESSPCSLASKCNIIIYYWHRGAAQKDVGKWQEMLTFKPDPGTASVTFSIAFRHFALSDSQQTWQKVLKKVWRISSNDKITTTTLNWNSCFFVVNDFC